MAPGFVPNFIKEVMSNIRVLRMPKVEDKTGLKRSKIYELLADGRFPKSLQLSGRSRGWLEEEIDFWIAQRISERDGKN